jgi:hypothetical protein
MGEEAERAFTAGLALYEARGSAGNAKTAAAVVRARVHYCTYRR